MPRQRVRLDVAGKNVRHALFHCQPLVSAVLCKASELGTPQSRAHMHASTQSDQRTYELSACCSPARPLAQAGHDHVPAAHAPEPAALLRQGMGLAQGRAGNGGQASGCGMLDLLN
jgi:hypothetical protein